MSPSTSSTSRGPRADGGRPRAGGSRPQGQRRRTPDAGTARDSRRPVEPADAAPLVATVRTGPVVTSFTELGVPAALADVLARQGITEAFPIQSATLPDSLAGRDVLGRGRTGSGKTIAFALPLVTRLTTSRRSTRPGHPRALVLLPTRELASQVHATIAPLARAAGLSTTIVFGGVSQGAQVRAFKAGVDIVVATPGRLEDLMNQRHVRLDDVEVTVLDEADHMADLGFLPAVKRILDKTAAGTQRLLFSATLDNGIDVLVRRYLVDPVTHSVDSDASTELDLEHHVFTVTESDKASVVQELASGEGRSLLFTRTKHGAKKLARQLTLAGVPAVDLHGNLAQNARDRNLAAFRSGEVRVLVATDIAARGIHVDDVSLVVHVDPPAEHKAYTHRSGRTARAGASGVVVTVATDAQRSDVALLARKAGIRPTAARVRPGATDITALTGPPAAYVAPSAAPAPEASRRPQQRGGRSQSGTKAAGRSASPSSRSAGPSSARPAGSTSAAAFSSRAGSRRGSR
ncbi:MAG: DEAD/DEAH box helicase [Actinomycetales bacterium]|nr:DEAD/DEAH box helicase [Actinomycetales bacterium]